ncbi:sugar kinase [Microbacterium oryzae]|uniref:sugar kinase n=1 Tax=Microbacterium oryzae TaxID=743009 RepID=UPI0025AF4E21|nr:sugar kinase [Microbacterium oryzae]MDN3312017.1 sugar kinase [Microbacterium oryzae]
MSHPLRSVFCVGETMTQLAPPPPVPLVETATLTVNAAGAESTVAMYLARLGHHAAWVSRLGADPLGERIRRMLTTHGVDIAHVEADASRPTGVYFKDPGAERTGIFYYRTGSAASALGIDDMPWSRLDGTALVHTSGITAALSTSTGELVDALLRRRKEHGHLVSFDVNYRPRLWGSRDASATLLRAARRADIVFVGLDEAAELWGARTSADVRRLLPEPDQLVVKDGGIAATLFAGDEAFTEPTTPVEVVEPVGAGDSFAAGYLHELLCGRDPLDRLRSGHRLAATVLATTADFVDPKGPAHGSEH